MSLVLKKFKLLASFSGGDSKKAPANTRGQAGSRRL